MTKEGGVAGLGVACLGGSKPRAEHRRRWRGGRRWQRRRALERKDLLLVVGQLKPFIGVTRGYF